MFYFLSGIDNVVLFAFSHHQTFLRVNQAVFGTVSLLPKTLLGYGTAIFSYFFY